MARTDIGEIGSFVFNVEIVFYYALLLSPGGNTCCVLVGVEFISTRILRVIRAKTSFAPTHDHPL